MIEADNVTEQRDAYARNLMKEADIGMAEHKSKNALGRSVLVKTVTDVKDGRTSENRSPRPFCISYYIIILGHFVIENYHFNVNQFRVLVKLKKIREKPGRGWVGQTPPRNFFVCVFLCFVCVHASNKNWVVIWPIYFFSDFRIFQLDKTDPLEVITKIGGLRLKMYNIYSNFYTTHLPRKAKYI